MTSAESEKSLATIHRKQRTKSGKLTCEFGIDFLHSGLSILPGSLNRANSKYTPSEVQVTVLPAATPCDATARKHSFFGTF